MTRAAGTGLRLASPATALAPAALMLVQLTSMVLVNVLNGKVTSGTVLPDSGILLTMATIAAVGLVVAWHQPGNSVGWLLLAVALCFVTAFNAGGYIEAAYHRGQPSTPLGPAALLLTPALLAAIPLFALVIMLFPDGRLPSRAWAAFTVTCLAFRTGGCRRGHGPPSP
jgi:hypothetical protein